MKKGLKQRYQEAMKAARRRSGLTQKEASEATSIALGTLRRWEQGVNEPDVESLVSLAELYMVTVDELLGVEWVRSPLFSDDERRLLDLYRDTNDQGKRAIMSVAEASRGVEGQAQDYLTVSASA